MKLHLWAGISLLAFAAAAPAARATPITFNYTGKLVDFTVKSTGTYQIGAFGAQGGGIVDGLTGRGAGGEGAVISGDFSLVAGEELEIAVGGMGGSASSSGSGGGGGSFVVRFVGPDMPLVPLVIAGGGGGAGAIGKVAGGAASISTTGGNGAGDPGISRAGGKGGKGGAGGHAGSNGSMSRIKISGGSGAGGGGGGFRSAGGRSDLAEGGGAFPGLAGGAAGASGGAAGGFGGGGAAELNLSGYGGGGGGGGYSGGGGGGDIYIYVRNDPNNALLVGGGGGGGGSYDGGTKPNREVSHLGNGAVTINELSAAASVSPALLDASVVSTDAPANGDPPAVPEPASAALLGVGLAGFAGFAASRRRSPAADDAVCEPSHRDRLSSRVHGLICG